LIQLFKLYLKGNNKLYILIAIFITSIIGIFLPTTLPYIAFLSLIFLIILALKEKNRAFKPKSDAYKELEKIKKKRKRADNKKHKVISDQLNYIKKHWGYTQTQTKVIENLLETRAYTNIYRKLTHSILPQLIELIDNCNQKNQIGCKREVNRRINELTTILKNAIKEHKTKKQETYEISLEVVDRLLRELKG